MLLQTSHSSGDSSTPDAAVCAIRPQQTCTVMLPVQAAWQQALGAQSVSTGRLHHVLLHCLCRLHGDRLLAPNLYRREDGTTCYFFSVEDLAQRVQAAGFDVRECDYACTLLKNKKRGLDMKRAFIHCIAQKPKVRASLFPAGLQ